MHTILSDPHQTPSARNVQAISPDARYACYAKDRVLLVALFDTGNTQSLAPVGVVLARVHSAGEPASEDTGADGDSRPLRRSDTTVPRLAPANGHAN